MNAVNAMLRDKQEAKLEAAVEAADQWLDLARPIIMAMFKLDDLESEVTRGCSYPGDHRSRVLREGAGYISKAAANLQDTLDGIRGDFVADNSKSWSRDLPESEGDAVDAFNDALSDETLSVKDAIKRVEAEWNDSFAMGAAT